MKPEHQTDLASLKDFQRITVEYAFRRLWLDDDQVKRFLVADEVGLGKTMVAKGVIARTVDHLWDSDKRNRYRLHLLQQPDRTPEPQPPQRRRRLEAQARRPPHPPAQGDRHLRDQRINFVSFTPEPRSRSAVARRIHGAGAAVLDARGLLGSQDRRARRAGSGSSRAA